MLSKIDNHRVDVVDGRLELFITKFALSKTERPTLVCVCWAGLIAYGPVADLSSRAHRVTKITALLLSRWALPFGAVAHVGVLLALESKIGHAHGAVWRANAAANAVVVRWAHLVPLVAPFVHVAQLRGRPRFAWRSGNRLLLVAILCILVHTFPWISSTTD